MPGSRDPAGTTGDESHGVEAARLICLRMLAAHPRTRAQLSEALRRRRIPEETVVAVLDRFAEVGLIDDAEFAEAWVETRHHGRGLGRRVLSEELRRRGVAPENVRAAIGIIGAEQEFATARRLVDKRLPGTRGRPAAARIRQLVGMLARKGYPSDVAYRVVREALEREAARGADGEASPAVRGGDPDSLRGAIEDSACLQDLAGLDEWPQDGDSMAD